MIPVGSVFEGIESKARGLVFQNMLVFLSTHVNNTDRVNLPLPANVAVSQFTIKTTYQ